jgi:hypothetical protein
MSHLIFVNGLGPNYKGDNIYEFIFSDEFTVWGDNWDAKPAHGYPNPPEVVYIKKVGVLKNTNITLELIQNSDLFGVTDAMEDIIALGWETDDSCGNEKRLVFRFGDTEKQVVDKLYERDLILHFENQNEYESAQS